MTVPYVTIGQQRLPAIGQGTWHMGEGQVPRQHEVRALQQGLDLGLTVIDTAEMYAEGGAEQVVGEALRGRRDSAFVVSKCYPWNAGRDSAIDACEASLQRLGIDTIDLYLLHWPGSIGLEETLEAFERLQETGKIRHFGVSNFDLDELQTLHDLDGGLHCAVNQVLYHLASRGTEVQLQPWMRQHSMPMMAYCPLAQAGAWGTDPLASPAIIELAEEHGITPAQLLLAWCIRSGAEQRDVIAIPKASSERHVSDNAAALDVQLSDATLTRLDALYPAPTRKVPLDIV
ncbi:aldo/keto reductase [Halomonas cupida]|uniref:aldo/keto reductase n=1 Tax=Halomonas cupida TaxID=44933 RepID=UPI0039B37FA5